MEGNAHSDDEPVSKSSRKISPIIVSKDDYRPVLSDDDDAEDTNDSLDIKPPQAAVHHHKNKSKRNRDKHLIREIARREHGYSSKSDVVSHRKSHHHSREHREHREERIREKRHHRQRHEEMRESKREREQRERDREHSDMIRSKEKIADHGGQRIIEDLREKLIDKRREEGERRAKHDKKDRERERRMEEEQSHTPPPMKETPKEKAERLERELRREKLLEAEREMMRQKEVYRRELEARRERRHLEKAQERTLREIVKKRGGSGSKDRKRKKGDENEEISDSEKEETTEFEAQEERVVVTLSDGSDEETKPAQPSDMVVEDSDIDEDDQKTPKRSDDLTEGEIEDEEEENESESSTDTEDEGETDDTERHDSPEHHKRSDSEVEEDVRKSVDMEVVEDEEKVSGSVDTPAVEEKEASEEELRPYYPALQGCRSVEEFQCLNRIEEGTYGVVYRARDKRTDEIVALKRLKMEKEKEGFPITSLREINTLLKAQHDNIVTVREIVVGSNMDKIFIVMNYVEHDLKSLMETMKQKKQAFIPGEVKCLMQQLLRAVAHLHDNWILHRDLKTSNLLLSHKGILKVGDFGLAREYGSPLKPYTPIVVTLWYRAPELLLGVKEYSTHVDMWSVGCIFGELLTMEALFPGKSDVDQLNRIFKELGTPNERIWPGYNKLPAVQKMTFTEYPVNQLRQRFGTEFTDIGMDLMNKFLTYNPKQRVTAEDGLRHPYFEEAPLPIDPAMFPTWPAKSELGHRKALAASPKPPPGGAGYKQLTDTDEDVSSVGFHMGSAEKGRSNVGAGFSLKF